MAQTYRWLPHRPFNLISDVGTLNIINDADGVENSCCRPPADVPDWDNLQRLLLFDLINEHGSRLLCLLLWRSDNVVSGPMTALRGW